MSVGIRHWDKTGTTVISGGVNWGTAFAGTIITPRKYFVENMSDRLLSNVVMEIVNVSSDAALYFRTGADTGTVIPPYNVTAVSSAPGSGGTWSLIGTYYYVITALNGLGETQKSFQTFATITDLTQVITIDWQPSPGATMYNIYRSMVSGVFTSPALLLQTLSGLHDPFIDDGSITLASGAPPATNTTAGGAPNYGTPPTFGSSSITIGNLDLHQEFVYWVDWIVPTAISELLNPRLARLHFFENV